jgi:methylmalonyl-CoA/ethylmalonyl-CoA epimerase
MGNAEFSLSHIGQIAFTVRDLDLAVVFYRDRLKLPFLFKVPNLAFFDCGGTRLMLTLPESESFESVNAVLYFYVDDIESAYKVLYERGVTFLDTPHLIAKMDDHDLWMAFFQDPDENTLAVMSEVRVEV